MELLADKAAEKAILGCILKNGINAYHDVCAMMSLDVFTDTAHAAIFKTIKYAADNNVSTFDIPTILSLAKQEKIHAFVNKTELGECLKAACALDNLGILVGKIRKLEIARIISEQLESRRKSVDNLSGSESISHILSLTEFNLESLFNDVKAAKQMGESAEERLRALAENPVVQIGISTGYPILDAAIGGGLRGGSVNVIGARMKVGKSHFLNNIALNTANNNVKVLYLDTEMSTEEQENRCIANLAEVDVNLIETGKFGKNELVFGKTLRAAQQLKKLPYHHMNVTGLSFEEQVAIISRWLRANQTLDSNNNIAQCMVIYDYLKLCTADGMENLAEYQLLGFMISTLHNLAVKFNIPITTAVQLNRDGIDKESTGVAAGSDRILWLCSNFSIFKYKSREELKEDPIENGNRKLVIMAARHGPGLGDLDYINYTLDGYKAKLSEGALRSTNAKK